MATNVIMPALGMAQEKGRLIRWLVEPGATVNKGDRLMEGETDDIVNNPEVRRLYLGEGFRM